MPDIQSPPSEHWGLKRAGDWHLHFCWLPSECFLTGRKLWLERCYKGTHKITGPGYGTVRPGDPVFVDYYIDKYEFLIWQLKRNT